MRKAAREAAPRGKEARLAAELNAYIGAMIAFCTTARDFVPAGAGERMAIKPLF